MATIRENKKDGKVISYRFTVCIERDIRGKQVRRYTTWTPQEGLTPSKARKAAERAADAWEQEVKAEYQKKKEAAAKGQAYALPPEKRKDDFVAFVQDTWMPLQVQSGNDKPATVVFYQSNVKLISKYFNGAILQNITPMDIEKFLAYLRTEYKCKSGKPLAPKTTHHIYATLNLIFGYAERQEIIAKNPMQKVAAPKKKKKPVDALTEEQAQRFFKLLPSLPLDFHCILLLFATTGIRRSECIGLKWKDIDEKACTLTVERGGAYTPQNGVVISTPKTVQTVFARSLSCQALCGFFKHTRSKCRVTIPTQF